MDSSPSFPLLPPPPPNPNPNSFPAHHHHHHHHHTTTAATTQTPDINITLSTLKHLIHLSKTTIHSLSKTLPTTTTSTTTVTCPYNSNHRLPPASLFRHHLHCPSSPAPIDLSLLQSLHYPKTLKSQLINHNNSNNCSTHIDLCISLHDYHTSLDPNFFYLDCPAVVSFPQHNKADRILNLPAVLSAECTGHGSDDITDIIDDSVKLLPSECYNVRTEVNQWNDFPSFYSHAVLRSIVCCYVYSKEDLMEWILVSSSFYGVVIDVFMRDHILLLFRLCLKAIVREASGYLVSISKGEFAGDMDRFDCSVLVRVLMWLASQFGILYGEVNGKLFAINMFKQSLLNVISKSLFFRDGSSGLSDFNGKTETFNESKEIDESRKEMILVSHVAAAVAALHERFAFETRIKAVHSSRFVPIYHRVQEHEYISKTADEERKKRPNYRPIIDHDGVLWQRGGNQDANKNKSREELLAEERDYKRRRMSYRGKKMKRSTTQVMRDIIDEYMEEIKHANMAGQPFVDATNLESEPPLISNVHADKYSHNEIIQKSLRKESASDNSMRSARYEDEVKEKRSARYEDEVKKRRSARYEDEVKEKRSARYDDEFKEKRLARYDDEAKEERNRHRHKDNRSSVRTKEHSSSPNNSHKSKHKDKKSSSILRNEFEDRYDPSESQ